MMLALLHLIEFSGSISVDDREIKTVPRNLLRSRITTLTQDGVELKGTVRFNMFPFDAPMPSDDHIIAALEGVGAREAARRIDDATLQILQDYLAAMRAAANDDDRKAHVTADIEFHRTILQASGNRLLNQIESFSTN